MERELSSTKKKNKEVKEEQKELYYNQVGELRYSGAALLAENDIFEHFIGCLDPQDLELQDEGEGAQAAGDSQPDGGSVERRQNLCSNLSDPLQLLTLEQKLYVLQREVTDTQQDQEKLQQKHERIQDNYKASVKEAELRLAEIRKAKKEFEHRLSKSMKDSRLEMKEPEKVLQYIEDRSKAAQLEKFNLKNQTLKVQEKKLQQQLQQKKEMGKADYEVFFPEYDVPRVDKSLHELQHSSFKVQRALSIHKEKLQTATLDSAELSNEITKRNLMLAKIDEEIQQAEKERLKAESLNQLLHKELTDYQAPDIMAYMSAKDKQKKLQQSIHSWERKVEIAEMAVKMHTRDWSKQRVTLTPANSTESGTRSGKGQTPIKLPNIAENHA
ncbi:coiled-coil domain-containing protein 113 [Kryptolebias marmoratus]|uniref:coiled-coil domain-containing protein 113 n=1 Tax=Kryptolebias marmoratus TaxID=37003 RepID=UPI0007F8B12E|nr:coiled-coil domain-containing protein 113 [Kryptolebias marmoratus]